MMDIMREEYSGAPVLGAYIHKGEAVVDSTYLSGLMAMPHDDIVKAAEKMGIMADRSHARATVHFNAARLQAFLEKRQRPEMWQSLAPLLARAALAGKGKAD